LELAVIDTIISDQGIYFPERTKIIEEFVSFLIEINLNVESTSLHRLFRNYGKKYLYTSTPMLFVRLKVKFRHTTVTHS